MAEPVHFLVVDRGTDGRYVVDLHGRASGRLITTSRHDTASDARAAAVAEAERRGGLEVVDKIEGAA